MQTFLPSRSFRHCARVLDDRRLGKQRVETLQSALQPNHGGSMPRPASWQLVLPGRMKDCLP